MKMAVVSLAGLLAAVVPDVSLANCPGRTGVLHGDTLVSIAIGCGINVEMLKQANPGLTDRNLVAGTFVVIPNPPLPSSSLGIGNPGIAIAPPLMPYQSRGTTATVIAPDVPLPASHGLPQGQAPGFLPAPFPAAPRQP